MREERGTEDSNVDESLAQIRRVEARLQLVSEVTRAFAEDTPDLTRLFDTIARKLSGGLRDICRVLLLSENGETLETASVYCPDPATLRAAQLTRTFRLSENPLLETVVRTGISSLATSGLGKHYDEVARMHGLRARLMVPLRSRGETIGILAWARLRSSSPSLDKYDLELAQTVADHAALAIGNARSYAAERAARMALEAAERRYRALLEHANDPISVLTEDGVILEVNRSWERMTGLPRAQAVGRTSADFAPHAQKAARTAEFRTAVARGGGSTPPMEVVRPDGSVVQVETSRTLVDVGGERIVLSIARDATERLRLEEQLRRAHGRVQHMAFQATVAEERARRRLAVILHDGIVQQVALSKIKLISVRPSLASEPRAAVDAAVALLSQSITESRSLVFELSPPVLYDLGLKAALAWLIEEMAKNHGMRVTLTDDDADKRLDDTTAAIVFRAVRELLMNVFKHAQSLEADVTLRRTRDQVEVVVDDAGVGFEPGGSAPADAQRGFGLLSLREQIVYLGGTVEITSARGQGTTARLWVPLKQESVPAG
jgi:PAS domain S-box-containing protein